MNALITVAALTVLVPAACAASPPLPAASILPRPTDRYTCERGTKLSVKLLGESAEVSVDGAAAVSLPSLGEDGTTFTNGHQTLYVKQGVVSWATGRMAAQTCKPA